MASDPVCPTVYGFAWGPATVERTTTLDRGKRGRWYVLRVNDLTIYVSPTGRTRVFRVRRRRERIVSSVELKAIGSSNG